MSAPLILVADDSQLIRAMLRDGLRRQGYQVAEAEDGEDALRSCRALRPDVVLLDVEMPNMDGYAVLQAIKLDPMLADTPVVFLTGRAETDDIVRGLQLGAHDYLRKPFDGSELLARVSAALRVKLLQDELRRRNEELDRSARIDVLTGIYNRRQLDQELHRLFGMSRRRGEHVGALMIDVDHFKAINDSLGHAAGDRVLRSVATRLQASVRPEDVFGRWGGEEFLVLVAAATADELTTLAERARFAVALAPVVIEVEDDPGAPPLPGGRRDIQVTVSIGGALAIEGDASDVLVRRADQAMYAAKGAGRNCVVIPEASASEAAPGG